MHRSARILTALLLTSCAPSKMAKDSVSDVPPVDTGSPVDSDGDGSPASEDCDDTDPAIYPGAPEWDCTDPVDYNCDGSSMYEDVDEDGTPACEDCDDSTVDVGPDAEEVCDGLDNDCDGDIDADATDATVFYGDSDGDSYGGSTFAVTACEAPPGYVDNSEDCDDLDATAYPGGTEVCDAADNDCDGSTDEDVQNTFYADADADGYGSVEVTEEACSAPVGFVANPLDCDDTNPATNPASYEICDGIDNNCDSAVDDETAINTSTFYLDNDGDTYGTATTTVDACDAPSGYVDNALDCDDSTGDISPLATEVCDSVDNDCDGDIDGSDAVDATTWYTDSDTDGYGDPSATTVACTAPSGTVTNGSDCDDTTGDISPDQTEICNSGVDDDCDGDADDDDSSVDLSTGDTWYADTDTDGYGDAASSTVACAQPSGFVANDQDCDDGDGTRALSCADGGTQATAGTTCATILADLSTSTDGTYWIDPDDDGDTSDAFEAYCDMTAGGWTYASVGVAFRFDYTGGTQELETPGATTTIHFTAVGAAAGRGYNTFSSCGSGSLTGGEGGEASGSASFAANTTLYIEVGGQGDDGGCADQGSYNTRVGGYNGGGRGSQGGSAGGGGTDVRTTDGDLSTRLLVAGGGGGCGYESCIYAGGDGGGLTGETSDTGSTGGSQTAGGAGGSSSGAFGIGGDNVQGNDEGGGGGGWYGGAAGGTSNQAGGGGSSYYGGMTADQATSSGGNTGDGYLEYIFQ